MKPKVCILGTLHHYQLDVYRPQFLNEIECLVSIHSADLLAEEAIEQLDTFPRIWANGKANITWKPVDLNRDERANIPDKNSSGIGTLVDLEFQNVREWVWVVRTAKAMKSSALLICGLAHAFSVAEKFQWAGFEVEANVFFDRSDDLRILEAK